MKLLYEGSHLLLDGQKHTGVTRYSTELFKELQDLAEVEAIKPKNKRFFNRLYKAIWINSVLYQAVQSAKPDALICPVMNAPLRPTGVPTLTIIHDLNFLLYPHYYSTWFVNYYKINIPLILNASTHIGVTTKYVRDQVCTLFPGSWSKVSVVSAGIGAIFGLNNKQDIVYKRLHERTNTIVAVASLDKHKNVPVLIEAFAQICSKLPHTLILVANKRKLISGDSIKKSLLKVPPGRIKIVSNLSDQALKELYASAQLMVFPSIFEGFGSPPLEAMSCGCPVIASESSCIPEVLLSAPVYFNPFSVQNLARQIESVLSSSTVWDRLHLEGLRVSSHYTYYRVAQNILNIFG